MESGSFVLHKKTKTKMNVAHVINGVIHCTWFDKDGDFQSNDFLETELEIIENVENSENKLSKFIQDNIEIFKDLKLTLSLDYKDKNIFKWGAELKDLQEEDKVLNKKQLSPIIFYYEEAFNDFLVFNYYKINSKKPLNHLKPFFENLIEYCKGL